MAVNDPRDERALDEAIEETFPASDAPANTVETGVVVRVPLHEEVTDNRELQRFQLEIDGRTAFLSYRRTPTMMTLVHTEVPEALRERGIGSALADAARHVADREGLRLEAECPFARAHLGLVS